jgi:IS4 transposase
MEQAIEDRIKVIVQEEMIRNCISRHHCIVTHTALDNMMKHVDGKINFLYRGVWGVGVLLFVQCVGIIITLLKEHPQ